MAKSVQIKTKRPRRSKGDVDVKPNEDVQSVENISQMRQLIGNLVIGVGGRAEIDVAKGTVGRSLLESGVLALTTAAKSKMPETTEPTDKAEIDVGDYRCPWCDQGANEKTVAQMHILEKHADAILYYYSETYRQIVESWRKPS